MANLLQQVLGQGSLPIEHIKLPSFEPPGSGIGGGEFRAALTEAIGRVEEARITSKNSVNRFMAGENEEIHNVVLNTQRAELAFEAFLQVRNKVVSAYQEIMRMQM